MVMTKRIDLVYITLVFLLFFTPFSHSQEKKVKDSSETTISEGYNQLQKLKKDARAQMENKDMNNPEKPADVPGDLYDMQNGASRPLYDPSGKRDPFKPFIQAPREEEVVITEATPPLKKYSLNEFRITGVVWVNNEPKAVVVDPEGNTYFLGKGDEIGNRNGVIEEVREDGLLVKEKRYFEDVFGNKKVEIKNSVLAFVDEGE